MSRSGSRYPSAFGHTPSYRSYVKGGLDAPTIGYSVGSSSGLGGLGGRSGLGSSGLGLGSSTLGDLSLPSYGRDLGFTGYARDSGLSPLGGGSGNYSAASNVSKVSKSSYSSLSDSSRDSGRPVVEYSKDATYRATQTGPSGIPHSSFAHSSSSYSSEDPYKNRVSNYSYNI